MTRRRIVKRRWRQNVEDFSFKKASRNSNGSRSFEVWYKHDFVGDCEIKYFRWGSSAKDVPKSIYGDYKIDEIKENPIVMRITKDLDPKDYTNDKIGRVLFVGSKNGFPEKILYAEIYPKYFDMVCTHKVLVEKIVKEKPKQQFEEDE